MKINSTKPHPQVVSAIRRQAAAIASMLTLEERETIECAEQLKIEAHFIYLKKTHEADSKVRLVLGQSLRASE